CLCLIFFCLHFYLLFSLFRFSGFTSFSSFALFCLITMSLVYVPLSLSLSLGLLADSFAMRRNADDIQNGQTRSLLFSSFSFFFFLLFFFSCSLLFSSFSFFFFALAFAYLASITTLL